MTISTVQRLCQGMCTLPDFPLSLHTYQDAPDSSRGTLGCRLGIEPILSGTIDPQCSLWDVSPLH